MDKKNCKLYIGKSIKYICHKMFWMGKLRGGKILAFHNLVINLRNAA